MIRPTLFCRSFVNKTTQQTVPAFRAPLAGRNSASVASALAQQLRSYQQQGGNLSRCVYSGYLGSGVLAIRFGGQSPTEAIRQSDGYRLPIYATYAAFLAANNGKAGRFGLLSSQPLARGSSGSVKVLRISVNNALVFFVDSRNQGLFRLEPAGFSAQLMPRSQEVQQVLADAAKASLQSLVQTKRSRMTAPARPLQQSLNRWEDIGLTPVMVASRSIAGLFADSKMQPASDFDASSLRLNMDDRIQSQLVAQIVPASYCKVQSSFYPVGFCVELEAKSVAEVVQCDAVFVGRDRELTLCRLLFDEIVKIQGGSPSPPVAATPEPSTGEAVPPAQGELIVEEGEVDLIDEGSASGEGLDAVPGDEIASGDGFEDPDQMLPEGMGTPIASACNATTVTEQFMCALMSVLTGLLQQAFSAPRP